MSLLRVLQRPPLFNACRHTSRLYATAKKPAAVAVGKPETQPPATLSSDIDGASKSSCPEGTELVGLNWLKGQPPVLAKADDEYPPWLWTLLEAKELPDDGPGGKAEKVKLRKQNRQRIREQNFMKTQ